MSTVACQEGRDDLAPHLICVKGLGLIELRTLDPQTAGKRLLQLGLRLVARNAAMLPDNAASAVDAGPTAINSGRAASNTFLEELWRSRRVHRRHTIQGKPPRRPRAPNRAATLRQGRLRCRKSRSHSHRLCPIPNQKPELVNC